MLVFLLGVLALTHPVSSLAYNYPNWTKGEDDCSGSIHDPTNLIWRETSWQFVTSWLDNEGWTIKTDPVWADSNYINDGGTCKEQKRHAFKNYVRVNRWHLRIWVLNNGEILGQAHRDEGTFPYHEAVNYEGAEEKVASYFDDPQWLVWDDYIYLGNFKGNSNGYATLIVLRYHK